MAVEVPGEGTTAGTPGRSIWLQEVRQGMAMHVPGKGTTAGTPWRVAGRSPGDGCTVNPTGRRY